MRWPAGTEGDPPGHGEERHHDVQQLVGDERPSVEVEQRPQEEPVDAPVIAMPATASARAMRQSRPSYAGAATSESVVSSTSTLDCTVK